MVAKCTHYWVIDSYNVGVCKYCQEVRDFDRLQGNESKLLGLKSEIGKAEGRARRSAAAKKRWEDLEYRAKQSVAMKAAWEDPEYRIKQKVTHMSLPGRHHKKEEF